MEEIEDMKELEKRIEDNMKEMQKYTEMLEVLKKQAEESKKGE